MNVFQTTRFLGNPLSSWLIVIGGIILAIILLKITRTVILKKLRNLSAKTKVTFDDFIIEILEKTFVPVLYFSAIYAGLNYLDLPDKVNSVANVIMLIICTFYVLRLINSVIQYLILNVLKQQDEADTKQRQAKGLLIIVKVVIWLFGIVFLLDNFGYNVSTIVAGLGIGGIAVALAAQTVLGDVFSYFSILFDRPFEIGDFIIVGDKLGVVEHIGIKTTRLKSLEGDQLICSNKDLTDSRIHNFKRMEKRRVAFTIGVTYQTSATSLNDIPEIVKQIILNDQHVNYDRGHLISFGDSSINYEFVYFIPSPDFALFKDIQQRILLNIYTEFEKREIEFAYPTQTLFIKKEEGEVKTQS